MKTKTPPLNKPAALTDDVFTARLKAVSTRDIEAFHAATDKLMEDLLIELGYVRAIRWLRKQPRYYA